MLSTVSPSLIAHGPALFPNAFPHLFSKPSTAGEWLAYYGCAQRFCLLDSLRLHTETKAGNAGSYSKSDEFEAS
jgi:hypothetical protein